MTAQPKRYLTESEYLDFERNSQEKHEYFAGEVFAMTGAGEWHNLIVANIIASLHGQIRGRPCRVYPSDMRLKVVKSALYTYPDVTVVCGPSEFTDPGKRDTLLNPTVIIEVLSPSTERYDRGLKFQHYRTLESLREYILISQDKPYVERYACGAAGEWTLTDAVGLEATLRLAALDAALALAAIYAGIEWPPLTPRVAEMQVEYAVAGESRGRRPGDP